MTILPQTMNHIVFTAPGGPEVIALSQAPMPQPGPGQVLIEVAAAGVNRPDCLQRAGGYPPPPGETSVPGLEVAGRVVGLGAGATEWTLGDEVCALVGSGGYAQYALAAGALCLPRPKNLSLVEAAALPENVFTVYDNVFTRGRLTAGETLLVHGGSSGIGSIAIQMATALGATVIATAGSEEKCAFCRELGASFAINYRSEDFVAAVKAATDGRGVDVVLDMVGADYIGKNLAVLALEGRLVQIAFLQGSILKDFNLMPMMLKRLTLTGSTLRPRSVAQKAMIARQLRTNIWPLIEQGRIAPRVHATFPLGQARAAHELMESSAHLGKIMLTVQHGGLEGGR